MTWGQRANSDRGEKKDSSEWESRKRQGMGKEERGPRLGRKLQEVGVEKRLQAEFEL